MKKKYKFYTNSTNTKVVEIGDIVPINNIRIKVTEQLVESLPMLFEEIKEPTLDYFVNKLLNEDENKRMWKKLKFHYPSIFYKKVFEDIAIFFNKESSNIGNTKWVILRNNMKLGEFKIEEFSVGNLTYFSAPTFPSLEAAEKAIEIMGDHITYVFEY